MKELNKNLVYKEEIIIIYLITLAYFTQSI